MKLAAILLASMAAATSAQAQTADFKCPSPGTVVDNSNGTQGTWQSQDGNSCRGQFRNSSGAQFPFVWYLPTVGLRADRSTAFAEQIKPWTLWPLAVGKKLTGRYDGIDNTGGITGSWFDTITVDRIEKVTTKLGTFDTFVVTREEQAISHQYKSVQREWYAAELGLVVKSTFTDNNGGNRSNEAVSVRR